MFSDFFRGYKSGTLPLSVLILRLTFFVMQTVNIYAFSLSGTLDALHLANKQRDISKLMLLNL